MRVAVTGASGYIGAWLCAGLAVRGHDIHAQDIRGDSEALPMVCESFECFDLAEGCSEWLSRVRPDVVIHLAALYGRVWGDVDMAKTAAVNAGITAVVARDTAACGSRLLYVSSSEVYGESANRGPVGPASVLRPLNMYGLTKKWGEEAAAAYAPDGLAVTRLNMPYGPALNPPFPGSPGLTSGRPGPLGFNVLHSMTWQAVHGMDLTVHAGTVRCFTWVGDTVKGIITVAESGRSGTWNVNRNDSHITLSALARKVVEAAGSSSRVIVQPVPDRVTMHKSLENGALLSLGWQPTVDLDEGIKRTMDHFGRYDKDGVWR